jgi:YHS domain-containing protein
MVRTIGLITLALASLLLYSGCGDQASKAGPQGSDSAKPPVTTKPTEHAHKPGGHGGLIAEIGGDDYHAEAVFAKEGVVKIYPLGRDETRVQEVELQKLEAYAQPEGAADSTPVDLHPVRQRGDAAGKTSMFMGRLPEDLWDKSLTLTVPITIDGKRFRFRIASHTPDGHDDEPMPNKVGGDKEKALYLTPGGKYTLDDIAANGNTTSSLKFKGIKSSHVLPKPGDRICPISMSKANANFTWIVDGQAYQFCCQPCVDEFVQAAKEQPDQLKPADSYKKK